MHGLLDITFERNGKKTVAHKICQRAPFKVLRPFYPEGLSPCHLYILNTVGGVLEGDQMDLAFHLEEGSEVLVVVPTATKIHSMPSGEARQSVQFILEAGAVLEYFPEPMLPFSGSAFIQKTALFLEEGATLFWTEILGPGRFERGELFLYRLYENQLTLRDQEGLIAHECFRLIPKETPVKGLGVMAGYSHLGSLYIICAKDYHEILLTAFRSIKMPGLFYGVTLLPRRGLMIRVLAHETPLLQDFFIRLWALFRKNVLRRPLPPVRRY